MDSSANADAMERGVAVRSPEFDEKKEHPQPSPTSTTLTSGSVTRFGNGIQFLNLSYLEDFTTWIGLRVGLTCMQIMPHLGHIPFEMLLNQCSAEENPDQTASH